MDDSPLRQEIGRVFKYGNVTALSYLSLIAGTALLTDLLHVPASYSYAFTLTLVYVAVYFASSRYVFRVAGSARNFHRFLLVVGVLFLLHNFVFNALVLYFDIHYVLAIVLNLAVLGPVRYLIYKTWVFPGR